MPHDLPKEWQELNIINNLILWTLYYSVDNFEVYKFHTELTWLKVFVLICSALKFLSFAWSSILCTHELLGISLLKHLIKHDILEFLYFRSLNNNPCYWFTIRLNDRSLSYLALPNSTPVKSIERLNSLMAIWNKRS